MSISFSCSGCGSRIKIADGAAGRLVSCPKCSMKTMVPGVKVDAPPSQDLTIPRAVLLEAPPPDALIAVVPATAQCPFCAETILVAAKKCRFCNEFLDPTLRAALTQQQVPQPVIQVINNTQLSADHRSQHTLDNKSESFSFADSKAVSNSKAKAVAKSGPLQTLAGCGCLIVITFFAIGIIAGMTADRSKEKKPPTPPQKAQP